MTALSEGGAKGRAEGGGGGGGWAKDTRSSRIPGCAERAVSSADSRSAKAQTAAADAFCGEAGDAPWDEDEAEEEKKGEGDARVAGGWARRSSCSVEGCGRAAAAVDMVLLKVAAMPRAKARHKGAGRKRRERERERKYSFFLSFFLSVAFVFALA